MTTKADFARERAESFLNSIEREGRAPTPEETRSYDSMLLMLADARRTEAKVDEINAHLAGSAADKRVDLAARKGADHIRAMIAKGETTMDADLVGAIESQRAISDFADGASLYANTFAATVAIYLRTLSPWLNVATLVRSADGRPLVAPGISADVSTFSPGEGTAITESSPTLIDTTITPVSYKSLTYISQEALQDAEYDISSIVAQDAARAISLSIGSAFTTTVLSGAQNGGTATGAGGGGGTNGTALSPFVGYEDLIALKFGRAAGYRQTGAWIMANSMIKKARLYRDGMGQYLWQPAISLGQPDMFDGNPVYEDPYLAAVASATKSVLFGGWDRALMAKLTNLRVQVSDQFKLDTDQLAIKCVMRAAVGVVDPAGAAYLVSNTA